jgi:hypothetical protein
MGPVLRSRLSFWLADCLLRVSLLAAPREIRRIRPGAFGAEEATSLKLEGFAFAFAGTAIIDSPSSRGAGMGNDNPFTRPGSASPAGCNGVPAGEKAYDVSEAGNDEVGVDIGEDVKEDALENGCPEGKEWTT